MELTASITEVDLWLHSLLDWSSNPIRNWNLLYPRPTDIDRPLNEPVPDKIRDYCADYDNRPSNTIDFMTAVANTFELLHCEFVCILF